jgi:hypothetical protein
VARVMNDSACGSKVLYDHWFSFFGRGAREKPKKKNKK